MGMGAERREDVGSVVLAEMDWRGSRDVCMADGAGNGREAVVGTGKVVGGVVAGGNGRADLESIVPTRKRHWAQTGLANATARRIHM